MEILDRIPFELDVKALFRRLRVAPDGEYAGDVRAVADRAARVARPKAVYRESFLGARDGDSVEVDNVRFVSRVLRVNLEGVERVFPYVATCGVELDALSAPAGDGFGRFCIESVKEMALGAATAFLALHIERRYGLAKKSSMNPGSGDRLVWPIEQQKALFSLFGDTAGLVGVRLTDSCLMIPNKSVSGLFYPTEIDFVACQLCRREQCQGRRAGFDERRFMEFARPEPAGTAYAKAPAPIPPGCRVW